ncbi:hypothetical protein GGD83_005012 [Rhodoblastus sphagnicola]|uniref:hypothetical protein n=1 Tax=Rhodoblastus sphagnicola TaxID=333368 RepID=UPI001304BC95|nr:hypothetical protein [Rhodoblastus sphagnicola]MBB4201174.1 hypothetical protein [Rhodoblastus sphagnicola]
MDDDSITCIGFDASKAKLAVAIAESGRTGEVRYFGEIEATPQACPANQGHLIRSVDE